MKNPAGDSVILLSAPPCNSTLFNVGFDDESPLATVPCPPNTGLNYKPNQPLAAFKGGNVQGEWTLVVAIVNTLGNGGVFNGWAIEFCAALTAKDPFLVLNDTLRVPPSGNRLIWQNRLVVDDEDNTSDQLQFTIVKNTEHGFVSLNGTQLGTGGNFTMKDVYSSAVRYTNTNPAATYDYFTFAVNDGTGGYFGTPRFNIVITDNADPVAVEETAGSRFGFTLFPNPTTGMVTASFDQVVRGKVNISILNVQGSTVLERNFDQLGDRVTLDTAGLSSGIYFVRVKTQTGVMTRKLVVE